MEFSKERKHMAERLNMAGGTPGPEPEGPPNTPPTDEELLRQTVGARVDYVLGLPDSEQAAAIKGLGLEIGGGADTEPAAPEADQPPEGFRGPEGEISPEYGRWLVDEFVKHRITMSYEVRYNAENTPRFRWICDEIQKYVDRWCEIRNDPDPWGPHKAYPKPKPRDSGQPFEIRPPEFLPKPQALQELNEAINRLREQYQLGVEHPAEQPTGFTPESLPTDAEGKQISVDTLRAQYNNPGNRQEFHRAWANLDVYFRQAKNRGFLKEVDAILNSTYQDIIRDGLVPAQAEVLLEQGLARAHRVAISEFMENPDVPEQFAGVGNAYVDVARRTLERTLHAQPQPDVREGEWSIPTQEQARQGQRETYWITTTWPKYYQVIARTEEQFLIAKDTFFKMIRTAGLGKSPDAVYEHIQNFIEAFKGAGGKQVEEGNISNEFLMENRLELEALLFVFVGNYSNEVYNHKRRYEAMIAMSRDEGPARWVGIYRSGKGGVASFTEIFDLDALMDIYMNPVGERGELDIIAGHFVQDIIQERVIERGMGIVLKDYDFREDYLGSDDLGAKIHADAELDRIKSDFAKIKRDISSNIRKLEEGQIAEDLLSERDRERLSAFKTNLKRLGLTRSKEEFKALYEGFDKGDTHITNYLRFKEDQAKPTGQRQFPDFARLPEGIRRSIDLGRIQAQVLAFRQAIADGQIKPGRDVKAVDLLSPRDRQIYQTAYAEAAANFDIAFQMQGVLGEKARRGRGFLYVDRNPHIRFYFEEWDRLRLQNKDINKRQEYEQLWASFSEDQKKSFQIGWMLSKMRDGKSLESFPEQWQNFYRNLSSEDKDDFVDNIPIYQAENWVNWGIFWTKMKYADAPAKVRRREVREARVRLIKELRTKGYEAQLWDDELGPDGQPKLMTFKRPLGRIDPNTGQFTKFKNGEVLGFNQAGEEVKLSFDDNGNPVGLEFDQDGKVLVYDKADPDTRQRKNYDSITKSTKARLVNDTLVEEAIATYQLAALGDDFRNRYTDHTYWYYQGNNRHTILTPRIFEAAKRIRDGLSRPEDEDILATARLVVDPTVRRIRKFPDRQQNREVKLIAAAVLESFQDKQRTRHALHRAFLPADGFEGRMQAGYRNEDWAGYDRFTMGIEEFAAQQTLRLARRGAAWIADNPMEHDAAGPRWGVHGVGGAVKVMADEIKKFAHQGIVGQFGLTKIFEVLEKAVEMYEGLVGHIDPQTGEHVFGLWEKPTDNNEKLNENYADAKVKILLSDPTKAIPFLYKFIQAFGRLQRVTHIMRVVDTDNDNSAGALNLEEVDVFDLEDGSFNTEIETNRDIRRNNGTARNRQYAFLYGEEGWKGFYNWLVDESPGGGADVYRRERFWNRLLKEKYADFEAESYDSAGDTRPVEAELLEVWLTEKII